MRSICSLMQNIRKMTIRALRCSKKCVVSVFFIVICMIVFVPSMRNIILYPIWPYAWREMGITDVIQLRFFTTNTIDEVEPLSSCPAVFKTNVQISDVDRTKLKDYSLVFSTKLRNPVHKRYLPSMTANDKVFMIYTYKVLVEALNRIKVDFFFVQGSLLGVHRHHGVIPWDDDIDITINLMDWKIVRQTLSCIEGFHLSVTKFMHWKFYPNSTSSGFAGYPFIDIFFYTENAEFIWSVSRSTSLYLVFSKRDTFPLTTGQFEGLEVPVPKNIDHVLKERYDFDICQSRGMDHKRRVIMIDSHIFRIPCPSLEYMYEMYNLDST